MNKIEGSWLETHILKYTTDSSGLQKYLGGFKLATETLYRTAEWWGVMLLATRGHDVFV